MRLNSKEWEQVQKSVLVEDLTRAKDSEIEDGGSKLLRERLAQALWGYLRCE